MLTCRPPALSADRVGNHRLRSFLRANDLQIKFTWALRGSGVFRKSAELAVDFTRWILAAETTTDLQRIGHELTPAAKAQFIGMDSERVREAYGARQVQLQPANGAMS